MIPRYSPRFALQIGLFAALLLLCFGVGFTGCGGGGSAGSAISITAPTITAQPTSQAAAVGSTVSLGVTATESNVNYQWFKDTVAINGATGASYTISSVTTTDAGTYYVIVTNSVGQVQSNSVTVTISATATTGSGLVTIP